MSVDWDSLVIGPLMEAFGDPITYTPAAGVAFQITGVFDNEYLDLNAIGSEIDRVGMPGNITTSRPVLGVQISQFSLVPTQGDKITLLSGASYTVMEVRQDGHGWAKLLLNEA